MSNPLPFEFISEKQAGRRHDGEAMRSFINRYMSGEIPDYQMSAWLMAVYFQGMAEEEAAVLTEAMIETGIRIEHPDVAGPIGDKHSTGGVGDKITLLLAPLAAACGLAVPTVTGRGLGFTGGTLDKLESIPGFRTGLSVDELREQVARSGLAFGAQSEEIVPADQRIYALRDVTSTVRSLPLITSSIVSKKAAEGIDALVFDVKCGHGAFMETLEQATELAGWLVRVAAHFGLHSAALITDMNQPLGRSVGNWLEVAESARGLRGDGVPGDVRELTLALGGTLLALSGLADTPAEGRERVQGAWDAGKGFDLFRRTVQEQGGDITVLERDEGPSAPAAEHLLHAPRTGYVTSMLAREFGLAGVELGAGRARADAEIDPAAGFLLHAKVGDAVEQGDPLVTVYGPDETTCREVAGRIEEAISIEEAAPDLAPLIIKAVTAQGEHAWSEFQHMEMGLPKGSAQA